MITEQGLSIPEVGRRLSIPKSTIANWVRAIATGTLAKSKKVVSGEEMEVARLKREIAELTMERDILKNPRKDLPLFPLFSPVPPFPPVCFFNTDTR
ncbi:MAG: transposase [Syntrophorhabdus aromaticivorans]|uniref:Transposase n=1 Tax=Syntrophorhabdus aromaticivorans TaxID=328301 RepID=A0A971M5R1_9BACT|nr:transposase [Syntrophorhabdus aromaticivorans]